jgi:hypothetical protein
VTRNALYHILQDDAQKSLQNSMGIIAISLVPSFMIPESRAATYNLMMCLWATEKFISYKEF